MRHSKRWAARLLTGLALLTGAGAGALAQTPPAPGETITGAQLQAWLDQKFS